MVRMCCRYQLLWACAAMPTFHSTGIVAHVLTPLVSGIPVGLFAPQAPAPPILPNARNILEAAIATGCNAMASMPIFIEVFPFTKYLICQKLSRLLDVVSLSRDSQVSVIVGMLGTSSIGSLLSAYPQKAHCILSVLVWGSFV